MNLESKPESIKSNELPLSKISSETAALQREPQSRTGFQFVSDSASKILNGFTLSDSSSQKATAEPAAKDESVFTWVYEQFFKSSSATPKVSAEQCSMTKPRVAFGLTQKYDVSCGNSGTGHISQSYFPYLNSFSLKMTDPKTGRETEVAQSTRVINPFGDTTFKITDSKGEVLAFISRNQERSLGQGPSKETTISYSIKDKQNKLIATTSPIKRGEDYYKLTDGKNEIASSGQGWLSNKIPVVFPEYYSLDIKANDKVSPPVVMILQALHAREASKHQ